MSRIVFFYENYEKIKILILILAVASLPFYHPLSSIFIIAGAVLTAVKIGTTWSKLRPRIDTLTVAFSVFFLLLMLGILYTDKDNIGYGFSLLEQNKTMILIPILFLDFKITPRTREILFLAFVSACFIAAIICVAVNVNISLSEYTVFMHEWRFSHDRLSEPIGMQAVYFALYLSMCVLILLNKILEVNSLSLLKKVIAVMMLLIFLALVISLGARTISVILLLIVMLSLIGYAISKKVYKVLFAAALIPVFVIGLIAYHPIVKTRFLDIQHKSFEGSNYGSYFARTNIWLPGLEVIKDNLFFGVGTGDHQMELNKKFAEHNYQEGIDNRFNMHNQYFQTMLNFGLVGLLVLLAIIYLQLKQSFVKSDWLYLAFIVLFTGSFLTEALLYRNKGLVFFVLFSFIFFKQESSKSSYSTRG